MCSFDKKLVIVHSMIHLMVNTTLTRTTMDRRDSDFYKLLIQIRPFKSSVVWSNFIHFM